ncbi:hypothetical protein [Spirosoma endophyticum]|nr:hypothetical protein [Spirosoma endophyticum]
MKNVRVGNHPFMDQSLIAKINSANVALQQLQPINGPTALIVSYVQIKTFCLDLLQANPDNPSFIQAFDMLNEANWKIASPMLDFYESKRVKSYQEAFSQLKATTQAAVTVLTQ